MIDKKYLEIIRGGLREKLGSYISGVVRKGIELYEFQKETLIKSYENLIKFSGNSSILLADEQGTGKTIQSLVLLGIMDLYRAGSGYGLIICPKSLKENWKKEIETKLSPEIVNNLEILNITSQDLNLANGKFLIGRIEEIIENNKKPILIVHYDIIDKFLEKFIIPTTRIKDNDKNILLNFYPNFLILDESHLIKNKDSKRFKVIKEIVEIFNGKLKIPTKNEIRRLIKELELIGQELITNIYNNKNIPHNSLLKRFINSLLARFQNYVNGYSSNPYRIWQDNLLELIYLLTYLPNSVKGDLDDIFILLNNLFTKLDEFRIIPRIFHYEKFFKNVDNLLKITKKQKEKLEGINIEYGDFIYSYIKDEWFGKKYKNGKIKLIIELSGTPITNNVVEFYPQLLLLDYVKYFSPTYNGFLRKFANVKLVDSKRTGKRFLKVLPPSPEKLEKLNKLLRETCLIRREKQEVLKDIIKDKKRVFEYLNSRFHILPQLITYLIIPYNLIFVSEILPYIDLKNLEETIKTIRTDLKQKGDFSPKFINPTQYIYEYILNDFIEVIPELYQELEYKGINHPLYELITFIPNNNSNGNSNGNNEEDETNLPIGEYFDKLYGILHLGGKIENLTNEFLKDNVKTDLSKLERIRKYTRLLEDMKFTIFKILLAYYLHYYLYKTYREELLGIREKYLNKKIGYVELKSKALRLINKVRILNSILKIPYTITRTLFILDWNKFQPSNLIEEIFNFEYSNVDEQYNKMIKTILFKLYNDLRDLIVGEKGDYKYVFTDYDVYIKGIIRKYFLPQFYRADIIDQMNLDQIIQAFAQTYQKITEITYLRNFDININSEDLEINNNNIKRFYNYLTINILNYLDFSRNGFIDTLLENGEIEKVIFFRDKFSKSPTPTSKFEEQIIHKFLTLLTLGNDITILKKHLPTYGIQNNEIFKFFDLGNYTNDNNNDDSGNRKLIVFTIFKETNKLLRKFFKEYLPNYFGRELINIFEIEAGQKPEEILKIVEEFNKNNKKSILIASLYVANYGLNIVGARYLIFNDLDFSPAKLLQGEDRIHRVGQTKTTYIIYPIIINNSIELPIFGIFSSKLNVFTYSISDHSKLLKEGRGLVKNNPFIELLFTI